MCSTVVLAEKPDQARKYANAFKIKNKTKHYIEIEKNDTFKDGAIITWALGHLVELQSPDYYDAKNKKWDMGNLPIFPSSFSYKIINDKRQHYTEVAKLLKSSSEVVIGTDIDREGEAIARLVINQANASDKKIKRLWINTLEKDEIIRGMNNLLDGKESYNYFVEAQTRQHADWLIGMNLSPLFTLQLQQKGLNNTLGIGRVQSPTIYLIYQRQKEIENFKKEIFYELESAFSHEKGEYKGKANIKEKDKKKIESIINNYNIKLDNNTIGVVKEVSKSTKVVGAPALHSLSTLQESANKQWKYTPKKVLQLAQNLYEKEYLSYPRTDCNFITTNEHDYLVDKVEEYKKLLNVSFETNLDESKKFVDNNKVEEHYALVPTRTIPNLNDLNAEEKNIYLEVLRTTLASFHDSCLVSETIIITEVNGLDFRTKGKIETQKGWKSLFPSKKEKENILPDVKKGDNLNAFISLKTGETKPPNRYTEGQLIKAMKTAGKYVDDKEDVSILKEVGGIGTGATRSDIIERIKSQGYIENKKNLLYVTEKGKILCESISNTLLASPEMTAKWELYLQKISKGEGSYDEFISQIKNFIEQMIKAIPNKLNNQEIADKISKINNEKKITDCPSSDCKGAIEDKGNFYGCSGYSKGCKISFPKKWAGKSLNKEIIKQLCTNKTTDKIKGFKGKKGNFEAKLILNEENKLEFD